MSTRDDLEAVVREQITRAVANALTTGVPSTGMFNRAVEMILKAADTYAVTEREAITHASGRNGEPAIHFATGAEWTACGLDGMDATEDPQHVTCGNCRQSKAYRTASATTWDTMAGAS